jgi:hypothetical protein
LEGQLTEDDNYQDWIWWVEAEENEQIVGFVFNLVLFIHNSKFGNSTNFVEVFLDANKWIEICSKIQFNLG